MVRTVHGDSYTAFVNRGQMANNMSIHNNCKSDGTRPVDVYILVIRVKYEFTDLLRI